MKKKTKDTRSCGSYFFRKMKTARYSSHCRSDDEHPTLLLEVVAQLEILLVTIDTINIQE